MEKIGLVIFFLIMGGLFVTISVYFLLRLINHIKNSSIVKGEITDKKEVEGISLQGEPSYYFFKYKIQYSVNNIIIEKWADFKMNKKLKIGERIDIYYRKDNVEEFIIFPKSEKWLYILLFFIGKIFIIMGILIFIIYNMLIFQT